MVCLLRLSFVRREQLFVVLFLFFKPCSSGEQSVVFDRIFSRGTVIVELLWLGVAPQNPDEVVEASLLARGSAL